MSELSRILNLDADNEIQVTLGGRPLVLRQQRRAIIERVLLLSQEVSRQAVAAVDGRVKRWNEAKEAEAADEVVPFEEVLTQNTEHWERSLPAFALMFGSEPNDAGYDELMAHLREYLSFSKAEQIFNAWYELNEVSRFFEAIGNPLVPKRVYEESLAARQAEVAEAVEAAVSKPE